MIDMLLDFLLPAVTILIAEFGDKSQIAVLTLSSKFKEHKKIFLGAMLAFLVVDGSAVLLGNFITEFVSASIMKTISGIIFIAFGLFTLLSQNVHDMKSKVHSAFIASFILVFFSELGDKTQIASMLFSTQYNPYLVFVGIISSLALLSLGAIFIGKNLMHHIKRNLLNAVSGLVFIVVGLITLLL